MPMFIFCSSVLMVLGEQFPDDLFETPYGSYTVTVSLTCDRIYYAEGGRGRAVSQGGKINFPCLDLTRVEWPSARGRMCAGQIVKVSTVKRCLTTCSSPSSVNRDGGCYVETSNIDRETNLKIREMEPELGNLVRANGRPDPFELLNLRGTLQRRHRIKTFTILWPPGHRRHAEPISVGSK